MNALTLLLIGIVVSASQALVGGLLARPQSLLSARAPRRAGAGQPRMADVVVEFTKTGKTVNAVVGTPLSQMCAKNGIKVKYNCKQGNCATCVINIDGRNVKACQGKVPSSRRIVKIKA